MEIVLAETFKVAAAWFTISALATFRSDTESPETVTMNVKMYFYPIFLASSIY